MALKREEGKVDRVRERIKGLHYALLGVSVAYLIYGTASMMASIRDKDYGEGLFTQFLALVLSGGSFGIPQAWKKENNP